MVNPRLSTQIGKRCNMAMLALVCACGPVFKVHLAGTYYELIKKVRMIWQYLLLLVEVRRTWQYLVLLAVDEKFPPNNNTPIVEQNFFLFCGRTIQLMANASRYGVPSG